MSSTENPHVTEGELPTRGQIATRIDLGCASYHELCCTFMLTIDDSPPSACDCGGEEMAKWYAENGPENGETR